MGAKDSGITLLTSDSRPKYANDALAVLALPRGAIYQFRYGLRYLPTDLKHELHASAGVRCSLLLGYREEVSLSETKQAVLVPLRWAELVSVECVAEFYVFTFRCLDYPLFADQPPQSRAALEAASRKYQQECTDWSLPVHRGLTSVARPQGASSREAWLWIARALAMSSPFSETHFLRIGPIARQGKEMALSIAGGAVKMTARRSVQLSVDYYAEKYKEHDARLSIVADPKLLRVGSGAERPLDCRYDSFRVWLYPESLAEETFAEIEVSTSDKRNGSAQTRVRIPIELHPSLGRTASKATLTGVSAMLVAAPGLLESSVDLTWKLALCALGAIVMVISSRL